MEAGGFEPPSRDASGRASTCLVGFLKFASSAANRQASDSTRPVSFHPSWTGQPAGASLLFDALARPTGKAWKNGPLIKQPCATESWQLMGRRVISQANRHPGHAARLSAIRSKPFAPIFTFKTSGNARQRSAIIALFT